MFLDAYIYLSICGFNCLLALYLPCVYEVYLPEFDVTHDQQFAALISDCVVTDLRLIPSNPPGIDIVYQIKENKLLSLKVHHK